MTAWLAQRAATAAAVAACESPAEASLLVALLAHTGASGFTFGPPGAGADWALTTQHEVDLPGGRRARLDVALQRGAMRVAVEVDGWEHHHATDEQEADDACREQALRLLGWTVLRVLAAAALTAPAAAVGGIVAELRRLEARPLLAGRVDDPLVARLRAVAGDAEEETRLLLQVEARARARLEARRVG